MIWMKFAFIVAVTLICIFFAKILLRKVFKIERLKKERFTNHYVNDLHRKVDKVFRLVSTIILLSTFVVTILYFEESYQIIFIAFLIFILVESLIKAFFEWKYSKSPKQSILTVAEGAILLLAAIIVLQFDLLF